MNNLSNNTTIRMCPISHNKNCRQPSFIQVKDYRPKIQCHSITHKPRDEYNIVYITFLILGVAILLPWNIFITCQDYFVQYKLNTNTSYNASYTQNFVGIVGAIGQWTNVFVIILNVVFASSNKSTILRIPVSIGVSMVCILYHAIMTVTDTYDWPLVFFSSCCISVAIMFVASAIMSSCVYSIATKFPISYINAVVVGTNLSGCITTLFSIVSKLVAPDYQVAATYYFTATLLLLFIAMLMYFVMHYMDFFEYKTCVCLDECIYDSISDCIEPTSSRMSLLSKTWPFFFCIWLNFFSTLLIFPVYQLGIVPGSGFFISPEWYQDVLTFATFNIMVICGNYLPRLTGQIRPSILLPLVIVRAVGMVVFFAFCNYNPDGRTLPVLIKNDFVYWIGSSISTLLFGYFTSLLMMCTPRQVNAKQGGVVAMIASLCIAIGCACGVQCAPLLKLII